MLNKSKIELEVRSVKAPVPTGTATPTLRSTDYNKEGTDSSKCINL